jgi:hypothetical protein
LYASWLGLDLNILVDLASHEPLRLSRCYNQQASRFLNFELS